MNPDDEEFNESEFDSESKEADGADAPIAEPIDEPIRDEKN